MNVANHYFAPYRYMKPGKLEDTPNNDWYCVKGGLPPLALRKKKEKEKSSPRRGRTITAAATTTTNTSPTVTTDAVIVPIIFPTTKIADDFDFNSMECELQTSCWWRISYWFMNTFPSFYKFIGLIYLFFVDVITEKNGEECDNDINCFEMEGGIFADVYNYDLLAYNSRQTKKATPTHRINNNNNTTTLPTSAAVLAVSTVPTAPAVTPADDVDSMECKPRTPSPCCWWGWDAYYWFMKTFPRLYKICGLIYLFSTDAITGKDWEVNDYDNDYRNFQSRSNGAPNFF